MSTFQIEIAAQLAHNPQASAREILQVLGVSVCLYTVAQVAQVRSYL